MACAVSQQVTVWSQGLQRRGSFLCVYVCGGHVCVAYSVWSVSVGVVYACTVYVWYKLCVVCVCGVRCVGGVGVGVCVSPQSP